MTWSSHAYSSPLPDLTTSFSLTIPSSTDVWAKPPSRNAFNAPFIYQTLRLSQLTSVQITVTASWTQQYDQGGIMVVVPSKTSQPDRWVKSGVELLDGVARVGTVARDIWADWSLHPVVHGDGKTATVLFENKTGDALWVYLIGEDGKRHPLREVTWWAGLDGEQEVQVGVYGAKPSTEGKLKVEYRHLEIVKS
ncbi:Hybrid signal transduction histidine kinase K [Sphaceloma murrayae]|uniref:Hybrid signal transduction histidine kinase K n=1 Tax=Sphaceloma murrayae TaxID=2082308 RepID=A0A2K1QSC8_9PEZI|nr:Hybrid signal transduction histidine kinase K [Sphaceloma murrayae]